MLFPLGEESSWFGVVVYVAADLVMLGLNVTNAYSYAFAWVAPLLLALYAVTGRTAPEPRPAAVPA